MLATALPPVLQAPAAVPGPAPAAGGSESGPFSQWLDAADAQREAEPATTPAAGPSAQKPAGAAAKHPVRAPHREKPAQAQAAEAAGPGRDEVADAATEAGATDDPAGAVRNLLAATPDAGALLAELAALARPAALPGAEQASQAAVASDAPLAVGSTLAGVLVESGLARPGSAREADPAVLADARPGKSPLPDLAPALAKPSGSAAAGQAPERALRAVAGEEATPSVAAPAAAFSRQLAQARAGEHAADAPAALEREPGTAAAERPQAAAEATALPTQPLAAPALAAAPAVAAAPAQAQVLASPGSPEFAAELGAQLTTFVRGGVQHARLELHPAELGPVTVQIQLDGALAQVNLSAEHAFTRQALEEALPALAGSLRESGLTLGGGGVFEQPRQPQPGNGQGAPEGRRERGSGADSGNGNTVAASSLPTPRRRGVVDLMA